MKVLLIILLKRSVTESRQCKKKCQNAAQKGENNLKAAGAPLLEKHLGGPREVSLVPTHLSVGLGMPSDSPRLWRANVTMAGQLFSNTISLSYCVNTVSTWNYELPFSPSWKCVFSSQYWSAWLQMFWLWGCLMLDFHFRLSMCCVLCTQPSRGVWRDGIF